jgi:hypothetical protein
MSNFQSDELLPVDTLDDPRKLVPLAATVEDSGPPGEQAVLGELVNADFIENTANWISLPKTKRRYKSFLLNGQTAGTVLAHEVIGPDIKEFINRDREAEASMLYNDYCLQIVVEILGNPSVVGEVVSYFTPLVEPIPGRSFAEPRILQNIVQNNQGVNIVNHLALHTFRNGRSIWTIPANKPFRMFRQNDTSTKYAMEPLQDNFVVGHFYVQCLTDIRAKTTQTSSAQLIMWTSAMVRYRGAAFEPE